MVKGRPWCDHLVLVGQGLAQSVLGELGQGERGGVDLGAVVPAAAEEMGMSQESVTDICMALLEPKA